MAEVETSGGHFGRNDLGGAKRHAAERASCFFDHSHCKTGRIGRNEILDELTVHGERAQESMNIAPRVSFAGRRIFADLLMHLPGGADEKPLNLHTL